MCYMTKCPYVPPHPWNVDFPHTMLRAKVKKFRDGKLTFRDKLLTSTDKLGKLATIPVVVEMVNAVNRTPAMRAMMQATLGIAKGAALPPYTNPTLREQAARSVAWPVRDGARTPGKVAVFTTCYVNYNEPGIGRDLLAILEHNEISYKLASGESCCGMPKLEIGDLDTVQSLMERNLPSLTALAREGYAIVTPVPSCTLMWKQELPLLFPENEDVKLVSDAMFDPFEYFVLRDKDALMRRDFVRPLGKVSYHIPCHARVQNVGQKTREALSWIPGTEINTVERCAGHDGSYGVKAEFFATSMKIGKPVFARMADGDPDFVSSDCPIAGRRITQGIEEKGAMRGRKEHPLTLLRMAYGL
jgi:glycerol-3-phosphate dehydrogenase subunit C